MPLRPITIARLTFGALLAAAAARVLRRKPEPCPGPHYVRVDGASKQDVAELREVIRRLREDLDELASIVKAQHAINKRMANDLVTVIEVKLPAIGERLERLEKR